MRAHTRTHARTLPGMAAARVMLWLMVLRRWLSTERRRCCTSCKTTARSTHLGHTCPLPHKSQALPHCRYASSIHPSRSAPSRRGCRQRSAREDTCEPFVECNSIEYRFIHDTQCMRRVGAADRSPMSERPLDPPPWCARAALDRSIDCAMAERARRTSSRGKQGRTCCSSTR